MTGDPLPLRTVHHIPGSTQFCLWLSQQIACSAAWSTDLGTSPAWNILGPKSSELPYTPAWCSYMRSPNCPAPVWEAKHQGKIPANCLEILWDRKLHIWLMICVSPPAVLLHCKDLGAGEPAEGGGKRKKEGSTEGTTEKPQQTQGVPFLSWIGSRNGGSPFLEIQTKVVAHGHMRWYHPAPWAVRLDLVIHCGPFQPDLLCEFGAPTSTGGPRTCWWQEQLDWAVPLHPLTSTYTPLHPLTPPYILLHQSTRENGFPCLLPGKSAQWAGSRWETSESKPHHDSLPLRPLKRSRTADFSPRTFPSLLGIKHRWHSAGGRHSTFLNGAWGSSPIFFLVFIIFHFFDFFFLCLFVLEA